MQSFLLRYLKWIFVLIVGVIATYGAIRLYYRITDGFTIANITSDFAYNPRWEISPLSQAQQNELDIALSQPYNYMGKGCQAYVFLSKDGNYILKLFKYQRFRTQPWLKYLTFIPAVDEYREIRANKKMQKLMGVFDSWKIAFESLQPETQLIYVHLNKSDNLNKSLLITDKMGIEHHLDLDRIEFLVQRKATQFVNAIRELMDAGDVMGARKLLSTMIRMIVSEYQRGIADNDHALLQNSGVYNGQPIHIDVGQFVYNDLARDPKVLRKDLFSKTYLLRKWLREHYPELVKDFETELRSVIGLRFDYMKPYFKPHD